MLHNPKRAFQPAPSSAAEARRLRLEYQRLQRRLSALHGEAGAQADAMRAEVDRIARELGLIRADSVHAVESKLRVALDLMREKGPASHKLLSSALTDLHYLAVLSERG